MEQNKKLCREMTGAYLEACDNYSQDIIGLYLKLQEIYRKHYPVLECRREEEFIFDSSMDIAFRLKFYPLATEIYTKNYKIKDAQEELVLSKNQSLKQDYSLLQGLEVTLRNLGLSIGKSFPKTFRDKINRMRPGMMVSFSEGSTYICESNDGNGSVVLSPLGTQRVTKLDISDFNKKASITINTFSQREMQEFYQKNKKKLSQTVESGYTFIDTAYTKLKTIEQDISRLHSKKVQVGPITFVVRKALVGNAIQWFGPDGSIIHQEQVAYLMSYLDTNPSETKYKRKEPSYKKTASDANFRIGIEHLLDDGKYVDAYTQMCNYSAANQDDLIIQTNSFTKTDTGEYKAGTIIFRNGEAYQISYEHNDFSSEQTVSSLSLEEFKAFCEQRYSDTYERNFTASLDTITKRYHSDNEQVKKNQVAIAKRLAEKETRQQTGVILSSDNFYEGNSGYEDLIDNLKEDDPTIRTFLSR